MHSLVFQFCFYVLLWTCAKHVGWNLINLEASRQHILRFLRFLRFLRLIWNKRPNRQAAAGGTCRAASTAPLSLGDLGAGWNVLHKPSLMHRETWTRREASITIDAPRYVSGQGLRPWRKTWQVLRVAWSLDAVHTWIYFDPSHFETSQRPLSSNRLMLTHALHCNKHVSSFKLHKHAQTKIKTY